MKASKLSLVASLLGYSGVAAAASGGGGHGDDAQQAVLVILLMVGAAYLLAHFVVDWLQRRFLFVSGVEYIVIGLGLSALHVFSDMGRLAPIIVLAAGWVGLVYGMQLDLRRTLSANDQAVRIALLESLGSGALVAWAAHYFLRSAIVDLPDDQAWLAAGVMGCASAAGSRSAIDLVSRRYDRDTALVHLLRRVAALGDLVSIAVFGLLFCVFHRGTTLSGFDPGVAGWAWITVLLGVALGVLFSVFLGDEESDNSRFLAMAGIIAFASGAAFFLDLSLLTVNLILGVMVANASQDGPGVADTIARTARPMSLVLLVFAGALWRAPWSWEGGTAAVVWSAAPAVGLTVAYILLRSGGKMIGSWFASLGTGLRPDLARGLLAQGDEALAMAISMRLVYDGPAVDLAYTAILGSVVVHELFAPRILKGLLIDAGEIRNEHPVGSLT